MSMPRKTWMGGLIVLLAAFTPWAMAQGVIDMKGKTAMVTGSTSGLGELVARRLGAMGATVIIHGLDEAKGKQIAEEITKAGPGRAVYYPGDFGSFAAVRALAKRVKADNKRLDLLINNAGILGASGSPRRESSDGNELVFQVNYLAHFLLTQELLPLLQSSAPARIVNVASIGQSPINFDDVMMKGNYQSMTAYSQSKLAEIMWTISLSEMVDAKKVTVNSLHPSTMMDTPMVTGAGMRAMSSVQDGANAVMQLAVGSALTGKTGLYYNVMNEGRANAQAYDAAARKRLWDLSVDLVKEK